MRKWICILAIALITGCGSGNVDGQFQRDLEQSLQGSGLVESVQVIHPDSPSLEELKAALEVELSKLGVDPNKTVSSAPSGKGIEVADLEVAKLFLSGTQSTVLGIQWTERFAGDYDLNGEVNIGDIQPMVLYWQQEALYEGFPFARGIDGVPSEDPKVKLGADPEDAKNWVLCQIDTDNNGVINLSDIAGIAQHFQQSLGGYNVYRRLAGEDSFTRLPNPNDPDSPVTILRSQAMQSGQTNPIFARPARYLFLDDDETPGQREYYVVAADTDGNEWDGNPYVFYHFQNETEFREPRANFQIRPDVFAIRFEPGSQIELNHSSSRAHEQGAIILQYAYDIGGDGIYDFVTNNSNPIQTTLTKEGLNLIRLRVTDSNGLMAYSETTVSVETNHPSVLNMQIDISDEFVPAIVRFGFVGTSDPDGIYGLSFEYGKQGTGDFEYPPNSHTTVIFEPGDYTGRMTVTDFFGTQTSIEQSFSLAEGGYINPGWTFSEVDGSKAFAIEPLSVAGKPAVVFNSTVNDEFAIVYKSALDQSGNEWGPRVVIDNDMYDFGMFPLQLREANGVPMVAYFDGNMSGGGVMYSRGLTPDGNEWIDPIRITGGMLAMPAFGISSGRPVIVTAGMPGLSVYSALDPMGDNWSEPLQEERLGIVFDWINVGGYEGFVFSESGIGSGLVLRPQDTDDPWGEPIPLPETVGEFYQPHAVCDGLLTFWTSHSSKVQQVQAQTPDAKVWKEPGMVDLPPGVFTSSFDVLVADGSAPWMCLYDYGKYELHFVQATDLRASSWGEPEVVTSYGNVGSGCKLVEVNGKPGIVYNDISNNKLMLAVKE